MYFVLKITELQNNREVVTKVHNATKDDIDEFGERFKQLKSVKVSDTEYRFHEWDKDKSDWVARIQISAKLS